MKKIFLTLLVAIGFISLKSSAQVSINANIGSQPLWGPVGYDHVDYYYLPDVESYYSVPKRQFVYLDNGRWNFSRSLPSRYRGYDLYNGYKVVINSRDAYHNFDNDRVRYGKYKKVKRQKAIKYSDDPRYYVVKGHPHGMPPGQAKKIYSKGNGAGNWKGNGGKKGNGGGKGNGKGKH
ncbi:hypothetical protein ACVWYG_002338 [Pedobacter sp. UYEF25]